jgi:hypothetical protein
MDLHESFVVAPEIFQAGGDVPWREESFFTMASREMKISRDADI